MSKILIQKTLQIFPNRGESQLHVITEEGNPDELPASPLINPEDEDAKYDTDLEIEGKVNI